MRLLTLCQDLLEPDESLESWGDRVPNRRLVWLGQTPFTIQMWLLRGFLGYLCRLLDCQSITQILSIILVRCILLSLRSKTWRSVTPLLPTWIYSRQSGGTVSFELPFTTNMTISTSKSQTFGSWVAIFHLRQSMAFLSHSLCGISGLAPLTNILL